MNEAAMPSDRSEIDVNEPCPKRWAELRGEGTKRWCDQCSLHVVDGAAMTRREAEETLSSSEGRVCMRLLKDADGRTIHRAEAPRSSVMDRVLRYGLTAAAGVLAACGDDRREPVDGTHGAGSATGSAGETNPNGGGTSERPLEILGDVCYPEDHPEQEPTEETRVAPVDVDGDVDQREDAPPRPREIMGTPGPISLKKPVPPEDSDSGSK